MFSTFALGNAIFILLFQASINNESNGFLTHWHLFAAAPLLFAAAYMLQYLRVQTEVSESQNTQDQPLPFSRIAGWAVLAIALMLGGFATYTQWTGEETLFIELWDIADIHRLAVACQPFELERAFSDDLGIPAPVCPALHRLSPRTPMDSRRSPAACRRHRVELRHPE